MKKSAEYFERKNQLIVWNKDTDKWFSEQEKKLGIVKQKKSTSNHKEKIKITIVVDVRNWALDNIAQSIRKYLENKYLISIIYIEDIPDMNMVHLFELCKDSNIIHFLWRGLLTLIDIDYTKDFLSFYNNGFFNFKTDIIKNKTIAFSVYDHLYLGKEIKQTENIMQYSKYYTVSSKKLYEIYNNLEFCKPIMEITDGVDLEKFKPMNLERFNNIEDRTIKIGWVGNSNWFSTTKDHKGINTIIKPAIAELRKEGFNVELYLADKQQGVIPHDKMINYYKNIDLYVCASISEGTPNPVLEAMACGVPIISTNVGIIEECFGELQKEFILKERSIVCLKDNIKMLIMDKDKFRKLSEENLKQIKAYNIEYKAQQFDNFYQYILEKENEK